jgi:diguanylate cyclase (GGDEF)-like protein
MTGWMLWTKPRRGIVYMLAVEALAVGISVWVAFALPVTRRDLVFCVVITTVGIVATETSRQVERMRRRLASTPHVNLTSVWTLSAALLTTPSMAATTTVLLYGHMWLRMWRRIAGRHPYKVVFSASMVVLSCFAAKGVAVLAPAGDVLGDISPGGLAWLVLVILVYSVVNSSLVGVAMYLNEDDDSLIRLLGSWQENSIEYATLCIGALTAVLLAWRPWLVALIFMPLYVLHRSVLIRQLEHAATTDQKTGLLNATSWQALATTELQRAKSNDTELAVLMVDLDHFKRVNDRYGHLAGDDVLRAVADAMRQEVRDFDLCGRFGGEEFVVVMPDTGLADAIATAKRICDRIRRVSVDRSTAGVPLDGLALSASIGVAAYPDAGTELDEILLAADNAMFAAKDSGRNQVRAVVATRAPDRQEPGSPEPRRRSPSAAD